MTREQLEEFFARLEGPEGCNFKEDDNGEITWQCKGGMNQELAARLLLAMGIAPEERKSFLDICTEYGGHCDCEILFNAEERIMADCEQLSLLYN